MERTTKKNFIFTILTFVLILAVCVVSAEVFLRIRNSTMKNSAAKILDYGDAYKNGLGNWAAGGKLKENFKDWVADGYGGKVWWENNSSGFRNDRDFAAYPEKGVIRILSMGDSFTAGYRVGQKETFSYLLEKWFNEGNDSLKFEVLVSNIEEPTKGLYYLTRHGKSFNPHAVFLGITIGNDITQSYVGLDPQGGFVLRDRGEAVEIENRESFRSDEFWEALKAYEIPSSCLSQGAPAEIRPGERMVKFLEEKSMAFKIIKEKIEIKSPQAIGSLYGEYNRPKLFDGINGLGFFMQPVHPEIEKAYQRLFLLLSAFKSFCDSNNIALAVMLFPQRFQVQPEDWEKTAQVYGLKESCFDLMYPNTRIMQFCRDNGIVCIDPTEKMMQIHKREGKSLYLPKGDMHWNKYGHEAFFRTTKDDLAAAVETAVNRQRGTRQH